MSDLLVIGLIFVYFIISGVMSYILEEFFDFEAVAAGLFWPILVPIGIGYKLSKTIRNKLL